MTNGVEGPLPLPSPTLSSRHPERSSSLLTNGVEGPRSTLISPNGPSLSNPNSPSIHLRDLWGAAKLSHLERESRRELDPTYHQLIPNPALGLPFAQRTVSANYTAWPKLPELFPVFFPGIKTSRDELLVSIDREKLRSNIGRYLDRTVPASEIEEEFPEVMKVRQGFSATEVRWQLQAKLWEAIQRGPTRDELIDKQIVRFCYRPFDLRWLYWDLQRTL